MFFPPWSSPEVFLFPLDLVVAFESSPPRLLHVAATTDGRGKGMGRGLSVSSAAGNHRGTHITHVSRAAANHTPRVDGKNGVTRSTMGTTCEGGGGDDGTVNSSKLLSCQPGCVGPNMALERTIAMCRTRGSAEKQGGCRCCATEACDGGARWSWRQRTDPRHTTMLATHGLRGHTIQQASLWRAALCRLAPASG